MPKALWDSHEEAIKRAKVGHRIDWRRKISDHVAFGLLAYTSLQIVVTMTALKNESGSILPYFALVVLVAAIIPAARLIEQRWEGLSDDDAADLGLAPQFRRDRLLIWAAAILLPFMVTGLYLGLSLLI